MYPKEILQFTKPNMIWIFGPFVCLAATIALCLFGSLVSDQVNENANRRHR